MTAVLLILKRFYNAMNGYFDQCKQSIDNLEECHTDSASKHVDCFEVHDKLYNAYIDLPDLVILVLLHPPCTLNIVVDRSLVQRQ